MLIIIIFNLLNWLRWVNLFCLFAGAEWERLLGRAALPVSVSCVCAGVWESRGRRGKVRLLHRTHSQGHQHALLLATSVWANCRVMLRKTEAVIWRQEAVQIHHRPDLCECYSSDDLQGDRFIMLISLFCFVGWIWHWWRLTKFPVVLLFKVPIEVIYSGNFKSLAFNSQIPEKKSLMQYGVKGT